MKTTMMRNSSVGDDWIVKMCEANPIKMLPDTVNPMFLTCPVRLSFPNLFVPQKPLNRDTDQAYYSTCILFPPSDLVDFDVLLTPWQNQMEKDFSGIPPESLHVPFRDQKEKEKYDGYTPGSLFMTVKTKIKPAVVDYKRSPITDESRVYPGVWAIVCVNMYSFGMTMPIKGVGFGLISVFVITDDDELSGGGGLSDTQMQGVTDGITVLSPKIDVPSGKTSLEDLFS